MKLKSYPLPLDPLLEPYPTVSVVIGNYNYGQYLGEAIDSLLQQTYPKVEIVVVDDGSSDHSREVMAQYGDRILGIYQKNGGQTEAFNTGVQHSTGQIICFLDADDTFHPEKVAKIVAAFKENPSWSQISHYWTTMDAAGNPLPHRQKTLSQGDVRALLLKYGRYRAALTSALAYRREVLHQILPIPQRRSNADAYLMAVAPFYGAIGVIPEPLMRYRIHGRNQHAGNLSIAHHLYEREWVVAQINNTAKRLFCHTYFDLQHDADYRTFKALQQGGVSLLEGLHILKLTLQQSIAMGRGPQETLVRLLWGGLCVLFPQQGLIALNIGVTKYLRYRLLGIKLPQTSTS
jgi:glycosyltransferase involved in cell wall biosynthesis